MPDAEKVIKSEAEWKKELTPEQYHIMREKGTEPPFGGEYCHSEEKGVYKCSACGNELFLSGDKFDSGTGWPSFTKPISEKSVDAKRDSSLGMERIEATCSRCGAHLGHVFDDGPQPTGKRYCMNSVALKLDKQE